MGISVYYRARRNQPLSDTEQQAVDTIIEKYNNRFKYSEKAELFSLYDDDPNAPDVILDGSVGIIHSFNPFALNYNIRHWLNCLGEIRAAVAGAEWHVHLDDLDAKWKNGRWSLLSGG